MAIQQAKSIGNSQMSLYKESELEKFYNEGPFTFRNVSTSYLNNFYVKTFDFNSILADKRQGDRIEIARSDTHILWLSVEYVINSTWSGKAYKQLEVWCYISDLNYTNQRRVIIGCYPMIYIDFPTRTNYPIYFSYSFSDEEKRAVLTFSSYTVGSFFSDEETFNTAQQINTKKSGVSGLDVDDYEFYNLTRNMISEYFSDPWQGAGIGGTGGGEGTFDFESDVLDLPNIPATDTLSSGFMSIYVSNLQKIRDLANYMWTDDFLTNIVKLTADPIDIIMSLYLFPFNVPYTTTKEVGAGNVHTNITMGVPDSQFYELDCGFLDIPYFYGAYLDYDPYTKCSLFLPYCGMFDISLDDIMGKNVAVKYRIDLITGVCCAYLIVNNSAIYTFTGMCAISIPITARNFESQYTSFMSIASTLVNPIKGVGGFIDAGSDIASAVMQSKPTIQRTGNVSSNLGFLGRQKPYFIFTVPNVAIPKNQNKFIGYPIFATYLLKDLSGYTEIQEIHLENMGCATENEIVEIERLLRGGVIL